jgi:hypothetical protein
MNHNNKMDYSADIYRQLEVEFNKTSLYRPMCVTRYRAGKELEYNVTGVVEATHARVRLIVEKFVGGGFAGQVYRVKVLDIASENGFIGNLRVGGVYAMKILIPPSGFSRVFRNMLYWIGFQGPFQLQVNPYAARSGALWQKFIRRGAKIWFGDETAVVDIYATLVDDKLGSCGELSEWIDGRTWKLEADDRLDLLRRWIKGKVVAGENLGSPEYRAKREFMHNFVEQLHHMGASEFARQYEWSTCKSQPNCLKRKNAENSSSDGLVAVDFRAGLALLPFLPMSPGDIKLISKGLARGRLVQFDRGDLNQLEKFIRNHQNDFDDMVSMLDELKAAESVYRNSVADITHNHIRLFFSRRLWSTILASAITGWKIRNLIDAKLQKKLQGNLMLTLIFMVAGVVPFLGRFFRRIWGQSDWRKHYAAMFTSLSYLRRAIRAKVIERTISWLMAERIVAKDAFKIIQQNWRCVYHWPLSVLPAGLHRFIADWSYAKDRLDYLFLRPIRLYFNPELREQWLREMVMEGREKHLLSQEDERIILSQIKESFIQKYLKSLAVHVCTLPVTQIVSVLVAIIYVLTHPEMPRAQAYGIGFGIIAVFQIVPISPGSLVRGLYVVYLVIREKNFKDYNIAVFLGFFKYIGYLAFPIQMTYRYPALARFMAGHWATEAVHVVPVFGERGALLEHGIFNLFYNWPLTIRRRMLIRSQIRAAIKPRYWHLIPCVISSSVLFIGADMVNLNKFGGLPSIREIWWLSLIIPLLCGVALTLGAGGADLWKRILSAALCGLAVGVISASVLALLNFSQSITAAGITTHCVWRVFLFAIFSIIGVLVTEINLPEPDTHP